MGNTPIFSALLAFSISVMANTALADHKSHHRHHKHHNHEHYVEAHYYQQESYGDYGRVIAARPIYQRVAVETPRESCHVETYAQETRRGGDSFTGTLVGGMVGAALGHELGNGRGGATAVGGVIGAAIGNDVKKGERVVRYRDEEVCRVQYRTEYEQQIVGYDVSYAYLGRVYHTRTDRHPGDSIPVDVAVRNFN